MHYDALGLVSEEDCLKNLQKAMLAAAKKGANCSAHFFVGSIMNGVVGIVAGGATWVFTRQPLLGGGAAVVVGGGLEILDYCHLSKCLKEVDQMKKDAQKAYADCM